MKYAFAAFIKATGLNLLSLKNTKLNKLCIDFQNFLLNPPNSTGIVREHFPRKTITAHIVRKWVSKIVNDYSDDFVETRNRLHFKTSK